MLSPARLSGRTPPRPRRPLRWALLLAVVGGLALGFRLGLNRTSAEVAEPILVSVYSLPKVTLYPLILLVFGLGVPAKIAFGTLHGIIPIAIFAMNAVRNVAAVHFKTARVMRLSRRQTLLTIVHSRRACPRSSSGLRIGFSLTLLGVLHRRDVRLAARARLPHHERHRPA